MTRSELKAHLLTIEGVVAVAQETEAQVQPDGVHRYVATLRVNTGDKMNYHNVAYYVENEGKDSESTFWENGEPKFINTPVELSYSQRVNEKLNTMISQGEVTGALVNQLYEVTKSALVTIFIPDPNDQVKVVQKQVLMRDIDGNLVLNDVSN